MMAPISFYFFLILSHLVLLLSAEGENGYVRNCPSSFLCGNLGEFRFPFTNSSRPDCGILVIYDCENPNSSVDKQIELEKEGSRFKIEEVNPVANSVSIHDNVPQKELSYCEAIKYNFTLPPSTPILSFYFPNIVKVFRCNRSLNINAPEPEYFKITSCHDYDIFHTPETEWMNPSPEMPSYDSGCSSCYLPFTFKRRPNPQDHNISLSPTLTVELKLSDECRDCYHNRGGQCRLIGEGIFYCAKENNGASMIGLVASAVGVGVLIMMICYFRTKLSSLNLACNNKSQTHENIKAFLRNHEPLAIRRYSYNEIKKMTVSFKDKLGQGGYGSVYKGKLHDGCPVAVKVLKESKGNGEEFINEVASISRTSHVNIVTLLGFCFEGAKRALVYEFMPNGSLEKFIYEENQSNSNNELACEILNKIAVGVARGLEYLHRGCNTRILHFDIKPHNILLDGNFFPKISDFGLSKICPRNESIISMLGARGTAGYIAPEVFSRSFGGVSHKSDVYSYGMMVLEMVGGRKNINVKADCSSEIYFPHWIYKRLELNEELALRSITKEGDKERMRKMAIVGLWCIQTNPSNRPTMGGVVEMLEGSVESLEVPPKPYLSSPPSSPAPLSSDTISLVQ